MKTEQEINFAGTILTSIWGYAIVIFVFANAIIYTAETFINSEFGIKSICFGGVILLMIATELPKFLNDMTFIKYKKVKK